MKLVFTNGKVLIALVVMFVLYLLPWIFIYDQSPFYYYPTGFSCKSNLYLLLCGINPKKTYDEWLLMGVVYITPSVLFMVHLIFLRVVSDKKKKIKNLHKLNAKQKFVLSSNTLSLVVFFFQSMNLLKSIFISVELNDYVVIVINYMFDLYPFLLLFFYCKDIGIKER